MASKGTYYFLKFHKRQWFYTIGMSLPINSRGHRDSGAQSLRVSPEGTQTVNQDSKLFA